MDQSTQARAGVCASGCDRLLGGRGLSVSVVENEVTDGSGELASPGVVTHLVRHGLTDAVVRQWMTERL